MESGSYRDALHTNGSAAYAPDAFPADAFRGITLSDAIPGRRLGWRTQYRAAIAGTDAALVALALIFAQTVRFGHNPVEVLGRVTDYTLLSVAIGVLWMALLSIFRTREIRHVGAGTTEYARVAKATFLTFGIVAVAAMLFKEDIARGYLLIALPAGLLGLVLGRRVWRSWLVARRREGLCLTGAFVVGNYRDVTRVTKDLVKHHHAGYKPIGVAFTDGFLGEEHARRDGLDVPAIDFGSLAETTKRTGTRAVILAGELPGGRDQIQDLGWQLENGRTELILVSRLTDVAGPRMHMRPVDGLPMMHVDLPQYAGFNHTLKRGIDISLASFAIAVLAPVLGMVALAVRLDSKGGVLFRQTRIGVSGEPFTMFKFRSMVTDAEARLAALEAANEGSGLLFKMKDDPRITRVGKILRRYSLDELPQLFNVLNGSMSMIGPRPPLPREVAEYEGRVNRRLLIKPGITGLWQVSGRSNLTWEESVKLDLYYVENWSVTTDFVILAKTVKAVVGKDGAY
jgi:exopolysaccharide biosynthesis polyprenyl glycosylphosphotransferase